jgi:hypothetical protein
VPATDEAAPPFETAELKSFAASLGSDNVKNDIIAKWLMLDWSCRLSTTHQKHKSYSCSSASRRRADAVDRWRSLEHLGVASFILQPARGTD